MLIIYKREATGGSAGETINQFPVFIENCGQALSEKEFGRTQRRAATCALERFLDTLHHAHLHRCFGGASHVLTSGLPGSLAVPPTTRAPGSA